MENNCNVFIVKTNQPGEDKYIEEKEINILFKNTLGNIYKLILNENISVGTALEKYLQIYNISKNNHSKINFLYNAEKLDLGNKTLLKDYFKGNLNPKILVNDVENLIGA